MRKAISAAGLTLVFKVDKGAEPGEYPNPAK